MTGRSFDVRVHSIRKKPQNRLPFEVRWKVGDRSRSRSFLTNALADGFRAELLSAARAGAAFDVESGLPDRMAPAPLAGPTWFEHATAYAEMKWPRLAPKSRTGVADTLATVTPALIVPGRRPPVDLRRALYAWAFNPSRTGEPPAEIVAALDWIRKASLPVERLDDDGELLRRALDALTRTMVGDAAAATTVRRKRAVFYNCLGFAVERRLLRSNPIDRIQWTAPEVADAIDRRLVANPAQVRALLAAVRAQGERGPKLVAFFACLYHAGMRPAEVVALTESDCWLPEEGWGRLDLTGSTPRVGRQWTDNGRPHERRQLKRRARNSTRPVPIPPELVVLLREHIESYGTASDGRLFRAVLGRELQESEFGDVWQKARTAALTPAQVKSPLANRPYDLRHAAASLWLNGGVAATEVAQRLGHSVAVLLRVYANCVDGQEQLANERISAALNTEKE